MRRFQFLAFPLPLLLSGLAFAGGGSSPEDALNGVHRIVFLGDSITYSGGYVEDLEAYLRLKYPTLRLEFLNLGLPSETVSGLTEPGHADDQFPRPDLHERLDRVLKRTKPDLVVACYGMNDGIYHPFSPARFEKFQNGMNLLHKKATAAGAKVLHVTPPVFDPVPIKANTLPAGLDEYKKPFEGYDEVLDHYSTWLLTRDAVGWNVVDVHGPMAQFLAAKREGDPKFRLAGDGVHIDSTGHWIIAREILIHWGANQDLRKTPSVEAALHTPAGSKVLALVQQRQRLLKDAWLTATGHKRPGMTTGLPLADAEKQAAEIEAEISAILPKTPTP